MIHADANLARRLESLISAEWRQLAGLCASLWPDRGAASLDVAGGVALWLGEGSPLNVASGLAMEGPIGKAELRAVEDFYARRGAPPILSTCPFADPSLFLLLGARGWRVTEFENVLALEVGAVADGPADGPPGIEVRVCETSVERESFGRLTALGFSDDGEPDPAHLQLGEMMAVHPDQVLLLAWADGAPVGTGSLKIAEGVAWLSADSTLPAFRGRGVQQAIQRHRLRLAREAGCDLAVTEAVPGSGSQRNMERLGFRVVYPHLEFARV